ncbi:hypothetical protein [Vulcanisaeta sp. JCM 16159]|uniref:hypothetical protein n=1 Tax=Vulcanisaeta sp. JCM 16159 TaxID=1295371 RepID=UPI000AEAF362|nr:hypothetical protein [Vulcanisaeta sp. JCM 16159]
MLKPLGGSIMLDGKPLHGGDVGYISHASGLDPNMTVRETWSFMPRLRALIT